MPYAIHVIVTKETTSVCVCREESLLRDADGDSEFSLLDISTFSKIDNKYYTVDALDIDDDDLMNEMEQLLA